LKSQIVESAVLGEPLVVPTPQAIDDVVYNRDLAKAVVLACDAPGPRHWQFNISGGELVTIREFAAEVMRLCPEHRLTIDESSRETRPPGTPATNGLLSNARAREEVRYAPDFPGIAGIADYVAWLRANVVPERVPVSGGGAA
jgi:nucleoside-diphosphate-sugar epimerase